METIDVVKKAIDHYGAESQMLVCIEEMSELMKELCKFQRYQDNVEHIAEEIADVEITLMQMKRLFDVHEDVEHWKAAKLKRLSDRIDDERREKSVF